MANPKSEIRNPKSPDRFAEYITAPGQRIAKTDGPPAPLPPAPTVARSEPVEPPPGAVPPPNPAPPQPGATAHQAAVAVSVMQGEPSFRPAPPDPPVLDAFRRHLENRPDADDPLRDLDRPNRELLGLLLPLAAAARRADLSGKTPRDAEALARQLAVAAEMVGEVAPLTVRKAVFVSKVRQFGDYELRPADKPFLPNGGLATLYAEIDNVPLAPIALLDGEPGFVVRLAGSFQIHDAAGRVVEQLDKERGKYVPAVGFEWAEKARSPLRDFYGKFEFALPPGPGRYTVTVEVRDPATGRAARQTVPFRVGE